MKTQHKVDCNIYASLSNIGMPEAGIFTCEYAHQLMRKGDCSKIYSKELQEELIKKGKLEMIIEPKK